MPIVFASLCLQNDEYLVLEFSFCISYIPDDTTEFLQQKADTTHMVTCEDGPC